MLQYIIVNLADTYHQGNFLKMIKKNSKIVKITQILHNEWFSKVLFP